MIINGNTLLAYAPIKDMLSSKQKDNGVTFGMSEAGYDIRIKQKVLFKPHGWHPNDSTPCVASTWHINGGRQVGYWQQGSFILGSSIEEFQMPTNLVGVVHDKSSWARKGLSVFNTVIESGWCGFLTLELVYHGNDELIIPAGSGIAQVIFHATSDTATYDGRYQNQPDRPVEAIHAR